MIKDAEDKGLITPGKFGNKNSNISWFFLVIQVFYLSNFLLSWLIIRIENI